MDKKQYTAYIKSLGINPNEPVPVSTERVGVRPGYLNDTPEVPTSTQRIGVRPGYLPIKASVSDSEYVGNLADTLEKPITQEEQDRRTKAAYSASAIGALGNAMSAFSNLAFTGGVAPSQKLPETYSPNKDVQNFRDRVNKVRDNYLSNITAQRRLDLQDEWYRQRAEAQKEDLAQRKDRLAFEREREQRLAETQELNTRKQEWKERYEQGRLDIAKEKNRIDEEYKRGMLSARARDAAIRELNAMGKSVEETRSFDADGNVVSKKTVTKPNGQTGKKVNGTMPGVQGNSRTMPGVRK